MSYSELRISQIVNRGQLGDDFAKCQAPLKSGWLFHAGSRRVVLENRHILRNEPNLALPENDIEREPDEMPFAEDDDVFEELSAAAPDPAFSGSVRFLISFRLSGARGNEP